MSNQLPATVSVGTTDTTVTLDGHHDHVYVLNLGTTVAYLRADGAAAVAAADGTHALPAAMQEPRKLRVHPTSGTLALDAGSPVTIIHGISTTSANLVHFTTERGC